MEPRDWHQHYDDGVPPTLEFEERTIPELFRRSVELAPDSTAVLFQNRCLTYRELGEEIERFGAALHALGVGPGTSVAIQLPNIPQVAIAYHAALQLGAKVVLTNPLYTPREIEHQWNDAECEVAVTMDFLWDQKVRSMRDRVPVKHFVMASIPEYLGFPLNLLAPLKLRKAEPPMIARVESGTGIHRFRDLVKSHAPRRAGFTPALDDIAVLQYTGGTTGVSKAAMLTHRNISFNVQQTITWCSDLTPGAEVVMTCLPLFHVFGMTVCMNLALCTQSAMLLIPNPRDTPSLLRGIEKHRVTIFPTVPAICNNLNNLPGFGEADVTSVRFCISGSAPMPKEVQTRFESFTGSTIIEGYGLSETSPLTHANPLAGKQQLGSIGLPVPSTDARIVDAEHPTRELPHGEEGELILHGPQVMQGYWKRPDETEKSMHGKWFLTGDLAVRDADGYFRIVGRKKDMININGMKVFPDEIDALLMADERILEAATIGAPHKKFGEIVKSFIVLVPGAALTEEEIVEYCKANLAPYKVPRAIEFLDELPKSTVLKVLRRELRDREAARAPSPDAS